MRLTRRISLIGFGVAALAVATGIGYGIGYVWGMDLSLWLRLPAATLIGFPALVLIDMGVRMIWHAINDLGPIQEWVDWLREAVEWDYHRALVYEQAYRIGDRLGIKVRPGEEQ